MQDQLPLPYDHISNQHVNYELLGFFILLASKEKEKFIVHKENLPTQQEICQVLNIRSRNTCKAHFSCLIEKQIITKENNDIIINIDNFSKIYYISKEILYQLILSQTKFCVKGYLYICNLIEKKKYIFSLQSFGDSIGIYIVHYANGYKQINKVLDCLNKNKIIKLTDIRVGQAPRKMLTDSIISPDAAKNYINYLNEQKEEPQPSLKDFPTKEETKKEKKEHSGYVYVIKMNEYYKIGISIQPKRKLGEYTKLPESPKTIYCVYCGQEYKDIEKELHCKYQNKNTNGEWFRLDSKDLQDIEKYLNSKRTQ